MSVQSTNFMEVLDGIRDAIAASASGTLGIDFPGLALGPAEEVLVFNSDDRIELVVESETTGYFHSTGHTVLSDLWGNKYPGSHGESSLPVEVSELLDALQWPPPQQKPYTKPPPDKTNTTRIGFAKNLIAFPDGSSLGTVGPSLAKIVPLKSGGIQFWEASVQAIAEGTGRFEGARGTLVFSGSAHFPDFPPALPQQLALLQKGFPARLVRCFKLVRKGKLGELPPPPSQSSAG